MTRMLMPVGNKATRLQHSWYRFQAASEAQCSHDKPDVWDLGAVPNRQMWPAWQRCRGTRAGSCISTPASCWHETAHAWHALAFFTVDRCAFGQLWMLLC